MRSCANLGDSLQSLGCNGPQFRFHVTVWGSAPLRYLLLFITEVRLSQIVVLITAPSTYDCNKRCLVQLITGPFIGKLVLTIKCDAEVWNLTFIWT